MARLGFYYPDFRPCIVNEKKALFHRWVDDAEAMGGGLYVGGPPPGQHWRVYGLVEYEDGSVGEVYPDSIKFLDSKFGCYYWPEENNKGEATCEKK